MNYSPSYVEIRLLKKGDVILVATSSREIKLVVRAPSERYSLVEMSEDLGDRETDAIPVYLDDIETGTPLSVLGIDLETCLYVGVPVTLDVYCNR